MSEDTPTAWIGALAATYSVEILEATAQPRSAAELSADLDAPIATVYRRLSDLADCDLLTEDGTRLSDDGRSEKVYRRTIDGFSIEFTQDDVVVEKTAYSEARASLARNWEALRQST